MTYEERKKLIEQSRANGGGVTYMNATQRALNRMAQEKAEKDSQELWDYATTPSYQIPSGRLKENAISKISLESTPLPENAPINPTPLKFNPVQVGTAETVAEGVKPVTQEQYDVIMQERNRKVTDYHTEENLRKKMQEETKLLLDNYGENYADTDWIDRIAYWDWEESSQDRQKQRAIESTEQYYQYKYDTDASIQEILESLALSRKETADLDELRRIDDDISQITNVLYADTVLSNGLGDHGFDELLNETFGITGGAAFNDALIKGVTTGLASSGAGALATVDATLGNLLKAFGWKNNPISEFNAEQQKNYQEEIESARIAWSALGATKGHIHTAVQVVSAMIPDVILAALSSGATASNAGSLKAIASLGTKSTAAQAAKAAITLDKAKTPLMSISKLGTGLTSATSQAFQQAAKNPFFWSTVTRSYGNDYNEAIEGGASQEAAYLYATITSLTNALVEVGGGIQVLPEKLQNKSKSQILQWVISSLEEGGEEVIQDVISDLNAKMMYDNDRPWISATDDSAVIDPSLIMSGAYGLFGGMTMGGGQVLANNIMSPTNYTKLGKAVRKTFNAEDFVVYASKSADEQIRELADKAGNGKLTNREIGVLYSYVASDVASAYKNARNLDEANNAYQMFEGAPKSIQVLAFSGYMSKLGELGITATSDIVQPETASTEAAPTQTEAEQAAPKRAGISNLSARNKSKDVLSRAVDGVIGVEDLTEDQKTLKKIGEQFGAKVEFANLDKYFINENGERVLDSPNGRFDPNTNTITLNTSNKVKHDPVEFILKHEMTHSFEINKEAYAIFAKEVLRSNVFKDYVKNQKGFASVDAWSKDIIDRYDKAGHPLGENATEKALGARKEMIADFVGDMLFGKQNEIAEELINAMSPTARRSFIEWVTDFLTEIKQAFLGKPEYTTIEQIEKDFLKLARKVEKQNSKAEQSDSNRSQNAAKNEKTTTEEGDGKKYDSAKDKKLYDYIKDAIAGKLPKKSFYKISDKISEKLARDIEKIVGFSVEEFGNEISPDSILHINNEHGANGTKDQSMQDYNDLAKISYVLDNYTKIKKGKKSNKYRNSDGTFAQTVVLQAKVNNEFYYVVEAVPYAKTKSLRVVSAFKNKKDTFPDELVSNDPKRYVQDENQSNVSNNSLPKTTSVVKENVEKVNVEIDEKTESASPLSYSLTSWEQSDYVDNRNTAAKELSEALGITQKKAKDYIDSINSIAKVIADDRTRLDYVAAKGRSTFVSNTEYGGSVDCSTLCPKRKILTGTFSAIQKALKNSALTAEEILDIRNRMKEKGLEVSCGLCYVEGSRAQMGKFSKEFIERYKKTNPEYVPDMFDVNTPEGVEQLRIDHPEVYEAYEKFWNNKGVLNEGDSVLFASQQKPKLYQTRTDYKGEILNKFKSEGNVVEKNKNGGLRLQSFSDFEIVHLIDMMQVVMDMSRVGLAGQAYTKVPDFALALGNTGLKINLSLIAKGVDENGNLIFDDVEGMPIDTAMRIRDMYSDNVGTILVAFNDAQLKAALADSRVDFIIPFHRSQWKKALYEKLGLPKGTKDYTYQQNEKYIKPVYYTTRNGTIGKRKATNYMPNEYWDFGKSGKENAEAYLKMCAENNKRPKFYKLLVDNKDGSYSLQPDGSTDGYWKLLIDFKMYNNDGVGVPQQPVKPDFNMEESLRMLEEYKGGHQQFPVDQETVDNFVKDYKAKHKMDDFVENESTEAKAPDNPYKGFSYSLPESVDTDSVIEALTRGEITEEEAKQMLKRGKIKNPIEIANTPKEAANTTPKLKEPKMKGEGDGESNLYDTLLESDIVTDEVKAQVENNTYIKNYGTTTNKATLKEALDRLDTYGLKEVRRFENLQPQHASAVDIAVGIILLQRYQDIGDTSGAIVIAEKLSSIASNAGRAVQIFSILSRFTPETMVAYAQHELDKAFDIMQKKQTKKWIEANKKKFQLTKEDIDIITQNTLYASDLQDGSHTKAILLGEITTLLQDKLPPEKGQALRAWMRISLLFNVKTNLRNFLGNASMASIYVGSDFFGSFVDKAISKKTGIRTTGVDPKILGTSIVKGGAKGVAETYDDFKRRIHTKQQELNRFQDNAIAGKSFNEQTQYEAINKIAKTLNEVDRITSMLLELGDRPFFEMWFMNSLETQKKLNKVSEPTPQMVEAAKLEALQRTWQDDNMVTKAVGQLKQALNNLTPGFGHTGYGLGDIALKFTKTPANIAKAMFELSPLGFGVAAADLVNMKRAMDKGEFTPAMQKRLTRSFGNAMIGTLIYLAVYGLAASGAIDFGGDGDDDKDVSNFEKYVLGVPPYSFKFLGHDITYTWNQPIGTVLAIVADIMDGAEEGDLSAWDVVSTAGQVFTSQSFLTNLYELFSKDDVLTGIISVVLSEPSAMVPTLFSQLASSLDPYRRTTYSDNLLQSTLNDILYRIPGLRMTLPKQVNVLGEESKNPQFANILKAFVDPSTQYPKASAETRDVATEVYALYEATSDKTVIPRVAPKSVTVKGKTVKFTTEEKNAFQKRTGELSVELLRELFALPEYQELTEEEKIDAVTSIYDYVNDKAKSELDIYDYEVLAEMEGKNNQGQYILKEETYNRLTDKAKQIIVDDYFFSSDVIKCKGDSKKLAKLFAKKSKK